jgi:hypothetical protein
MAYVFQQAQKAAAANHRRHGTAQADIGVVSGSRETLQSERHTIVHSILPYDGPPGFNVPPEKSRAATMVKRRDPGPGTHVHEHAETGLLMSLFAWPQRLRHQRTWEIESPAAVIAA